MIFAIGFLGTDYSPADDQPFLLWIKDQFEFGCNTKHDTRWFIEKTSMSMTQFKFHFIVIFMYTSLFMIVLFKIPYKYDRIEKTAKEKVVEKKRRAKARAKKRRR